MALFAALAAGIVLAGRGNATAGGASNGLGAHSAPAASNLTWDAACTADARVVWSELRFKKSRGRLYRLVNGSKWTYLAFPKSIRMLLPDGTIRTLRSGQTIQAGITSIVYTDSAPTSLVFKQVWKFHEFQPLEREECALRRLAGAARSPRVLCFDAATGAMATSYVGEPLGPADLLTVHRPIEQMLGLVGEMEALGVEHRDIVKPGVAATRLLTFAEGLAHAELDQLNHQLNQSVVKNLPRLGSEFHVTRGGRITLVDFGAARVNGSHACSPNITSRVSPMLHGGRPDRDSVQLLEGVHRALWRAVERVRNATGVQLVPRSHRGNPA